MKRLKQIFLALTKNERVVFIVASCATVASFVVVMGIVIAQATTVVPAAGGEYTEGMVGQPEYVNPVTASGEADESLVKLIYSNLADLADSVNVTPDGRTWTVHLKDGLTWQDGQKLTSDDVIFTIQSIEDPDANSPLAASWQGVAVNRVSELELQFTLAEPYVFFADNLSNLYILPKHLFADTPPGNWHLSDYNLKPIGSGPYEFVSYDKRSDGVISDYHLQAWSGYAGTKPLIQNFDFSYFANNDELIKSFDAGTVDGMGGLMASDMPSITRPYTVSSWRVPSYYAVFFNESKSIPLQDPAVRAALSEAVDRNALVSDVLGGYGAPDYGPIPQDAPYFVPTMTTSSLDDASATLTDAGWILATSTRVKIVQKTPVPLVVNLTVPDIDFLTKTAADLQTDWQALGATVNVTTEPPADIVSEAIKNRDYESLLFGNVLGPSSNLYAFWDSSQRFSPGLNLAIYSNKSVDNLVEAAEQDLSDASRTAQFAAAEQDIVNDVPAIFLYSPDYLTVTGKNLQGVAPGFIPDASDQFRQVAAWYLNTARVLK